MSVCASSTGLASATPGCAFTGPLVVLVDRETASAAEVLVAALQDSRGARVVGERSFGKGTITTKFPLSPELGGLVLSTAWYLRPSGARIERELRPEGDTGWGVAPDEGFEIGLADEELEPWRDRIALADGPPSLPIAEDPPAEATAAPDRGLARGIEAILSLLGESGARGLAVSACAPAPEGDEPEPLHPAAAWLADYRFRHPDNIPCPSEHRGVGMHDHQDDDRLEVVRKAIDEVLALESIPSLMGALRDARRPPEARLLAWASIEAQWQSAANGRERRPDVDMTYVRACAAGLDSQNWRDPRHYEKMY